MDLRSRTLTDSSDNHKVLVSDAAMPTTSRKTRPSIKAVKDAHAPKLMRMAGVMGVGIGGRLHARSICVMVTKLSKELRTKIPTTLDGFPVEIEVIGKGRPA